MKKISDNMIQNFSSVNHLSSFENKMSVLISYYIINNYRGELNNLEELGGRAQILRLASVKTDTDCQEIESN